MKTDKTIKFIIPGEPKAQQRHRSAIRQRKGKTGIKVRLEGGKIVTLFEKSDFFIHNYDLSSQDKADFARMVVPPDRPLLGPLRVDLFLFYGYLKGHYRTGRYSDLLKDSAPLWKETRPDKDNAEKFVFDALNGFLWHDDSQICAGGTIQQYSSDPRTEIYITPLGIKNRKDDLKDELHIQADRQLAETKKQQTEELAFSESL